MARIVAYEPALRDRIVELQRHLWSSDPALNDAYFEWKYERNPYLGTELIRVALQGDDVVGMRGLWGSAWEAGTPGGRSVVPCGGDFVIAPEQRGGGLAQQIVAATIAAAREAGYRHAFSEGGALATQITLLTTGWRRAGSLESMTRAAAAEAIEAAVELEPRPEAMAGLVRRLGHDGRLRHVRDQEYLAWRFACPLHTYRYLYTGGGGLDGYLVLDERGNIVDWEAERPDVRAALLAAAIALGEPLTIWAAGLAEETKALLTDAGFTAGEPSASIGDAFRRGRAREQLFVRSLGDEWTLEGCSLLDLDDWDLRMLYFDNF